MDLENIMLSKMNQSDKDKFLQDFTYMWNLMKRINEQTEQEQTHRYRDMTDRGWRGGGWVLGEKDIGIKQRKKPNRH